jgi:hypothetical protein
MTCFDEKSRPTQVVNFDYGPAPENENADQRLREIQQIWEWFRQRQQWILTGRTSRSRKLRAAIVQCQIEGRSISNIARQFRVSRQSAHEQLRNLTRFYEGETP